MKTPEIAILNHQFTLMFYLLLGLLGVVSFLSMPRSEDPMFDFPIVVVTVVYPGTQPEDLETLVLEPLEEAIGELEDIEKIQSDIEDGLVSIEIHFLQGSDADDVYDDVEQVVNRTRTQLPAEIARINVRKASPSNVNIFQVALVSEDASYRDLKRYADQLENRFERVAGVMKSDKWAIPHQQLLIRYDLPKMRLLGVSPDQLSAVIGGSAKNIPAGHIDVGSRRFNLRTSGDFDDLEQIRNLVVTSRDGHQLYVKDIAVVEFADDQPVYLARYQGERCVFVTVQQQKGVHIFTVSEQLQQQLDEFSQLLPEHISAVSVTRQADSVRLRVNGFFYSLLQGLVLVGLVVLLTVGLRPAILVLVAIPLSLAVGISWIDYAGYGLQQMTIVGLVIALGLLVDNAIVVITNVIHFRRQGYSAIESSIRGATGVSWALASGTITTLLAFFPMVMMQSNTGAFIRSMPLSVIFVLIASLFIAITLTPLLAAKFLPDSIVDQKPDLLDRVAHNGYQTVLARLVKYPKLVLLVVTLFFFASLSLFPIVGVSLFPKAEKNQLLVDVHLPQNASFEETNRVVAEVEKKLADYPLITGVAANVGHGNPMVYYNEREKQEASNFGQLLLILDHYDSSEVAVMVQDLRKQFAAMSDARVQLKELAQGPPVKAPIVVRVFAQNLSELRSAAEIVEQQMRIQGGLINIDNPISSDKIALKVVPHLEKAAMQGITHLDIDRAIRAQWQGERVGLFRDAYNEEFDIVTKMDRGGLSDGEALQRLTLTNRQGDLVPLSQLATTEFYSTPAQLEHYQRQRMVSLTADVDVGKEVAVATAALRNALESAGLPSSVSISFGGEEESRSTSFSGLLSAIVVSLLGIFSVLVLQFRSFSQPLIVLVTIPFALSGALLGLFTAGYSFSFMAFIGLASLMGIVVNNAIVLIDAANQRADSGESPNDAIIGAAGERFKPIIVTSITTIAGLVPLAASGSLLWGPLAWVIIGGMLVSTLLGLFLVPILFRLVSFRPPRLTRSE